MNDPPGAAKLAALLPATEGGNTMSVTADPGTVVQALESMQNRIAAPEPQGPAAVGRTDPFLAP